MQCLNSFNMYICKYKYNLDITITLSLICSYIHGFVWYFELFTIYTSLSWIYVVSHYFKASSKMLKSSIIHCRVHVPPSLVPSYSVGRKKAMWFCLFVCLFVYLFVCLKFFVPLENFSLIWRRHLCRWRAVKFDLCSELMAIEQFSLSHLLWQGASVYNGLLRGPVTLTPNAEHLAVDLSLPF